MPYVGDPYAEMGIPVSHPGAYKKLNKLGDFYAEYNAKKAELEAKGFTFTVVGTEAFSSQQNLNENGQDKDLEGNVYFDHWIVYHESGGYFPRPGQGWTWFYVLAKLEQAFFLFDEDDMNSYGEAMQQPGFVLDRQAKFQLGVAARIIWRVRQLKVAMVLEHFMCLDNRGRPTT